MLRIALLALLIGTTPALAAWHEHWTATSDTASSITGDVSLYSDRIVFAAGASLPFVKVRNISFADMGRAAVPATIYRITKPADPALLRGNTICGKPITYIVIWHVAPVLYSKNQGRAFAAFYGPKEPVSGGPGYCASLYYEIGK